MFYINSIRSIFFLTGFGWVLGLNAQPGIAIEDYSSMLWFAPQQLISQVNQKRTSDNVPFIGQISLKPCEAGSITLEPVTLFVPQDALLHAGRLSMYFYPEACPVHPLPEDVLNITFSGGHIRMLPAEVDHEGQIRLSVKVSSELRPEWSSVQDIVGLAYSQKMGRWAQISIYHWDEQTKTATFLTDPFAEFIAGIIKTPETTPTADFKSTDIKDYKTPPPHAGISMIQPPQANNMGSANLSYPIEIPAGRAGMQPRLSLNYNSDGGNGWLGQGWDISAPSITIETRFGVPLYDETLETETYLFQGQMLYPVAHRGVRVDRVTDRVFHPRVEGTFSKIIRHGDHPNNYWWEVVEKDGKRSYYGGKPGGVINSAVLKTATGNIAQWCLTEEHDPNGNIVRYAYSAQFDNGPDGNQSIGYTRYLSTINYTGSEDENGKYTIRFIRDQQMEGPQERRQDAFSYCTSGFKQSIASLLNRIEVSIDQSLIRVYEFDYEYGVFGKSLLHRVVQKDSEDSLFFEYSFDYYDDTVDDSGVFKPVAENHVSQYPSDDLGGFLLSDIVPGYSDKSTFLGGNKAFNYNLGIAVTVGRTGSGACKSGTIGGHYSFSQTNGTGINALLDINGDTYPDKIFVDNGQIKYRPCLGKVNGVIAYGSPKILIIDERVDAISKPRTRSHSFGPEANILGQYVSYTRTTTKTIEPVYFQDFNADGFIDLAFGGRVYFNRKDGDNQVFLPTSDGTVNPIPQGGAELDSSLTTGFDYTSFADENPLHDAVRTWIAPYDGLIRINSTIQLVEENSEEYREYSLKDGVYVRIEHNYVDGNSFGSTLLYQNTIDTSEINTIYTPENSRIVNKGDMIFFRVNSRYDGAFDQVSWEADIQYLDTNTGHSLVLHDANGKNVYHYNSAEDFLLSAPQEFGLPMSGVVRLEHEFDIPSLSDSLHLRILRKYLEGEEPDLEEITTILWDTVIAPHTTWSDSIVQLLEVNEDDFISFEASARSNVNWHAIEWNPIFEYVSYDDNGNSTSMLNPDGSSKVVFDGTVDKKGFFWPFDAEPQVLLTMPGDTQAYINVAYHFIDVSPLSHNNIAPDGYITLTIKTSDSLLHTTQVETPFPISMYYDTLSINLAEQVFYADLDSDTLYVDIHFSSFELASFFAEEAELSATITNSTTFQFPNAITRSFLPNIYSRVPNDLILLGNLYRGWGHFSYKIVDNAALQPVSRDTIVTYLQAYTNAGVDLAPENLPENPDDFEATDPDPTQRGLGLMYLDAKTDRWRGYDDLLFVSKELISSSRLGEDNDQIDIQSIAGGGLTAPPKQNKTISDNISGTVDLSQFINLDVPYAGTSLSGGSAYGSRTRSWQAIDFMDFNNDGFPDPLGNGRLQYTSYLGQRTNRIVLLDNFNIGIGAHESESSKWGIIDNGVTSEASILNTFVNSGSIEFSGNGASASTSFTLSKNTTVGLSNDVDYNQDYTVGSWRDVNGDGMIDAVRENGEVWLSLGYGFTSKEEWGNQVDIRKGVSKTISRGGSVSGILESATRCNGSWAFGVSLSKSENHSVFGHQDINGDGMEDILTVDEQNNLHVRFNLGQQYTNSIPWFENFKLDEGLSVNESVNGAFTVCFNFPLPPFRICFNPKGNLGHNVSTPRTRIADINGDGLPDFLKSSSDDNLTYALSNIGRTNKLKTVRGPLGAEMTLDYDVIPASYENPSPQWVLSSIETYDGYEEDGANTQKTSFEYAGGYKDRRERNFYGFSHVVTHTLDTENDNAIYRSAIQHYANDTYYRKGLLLADTLMDAAGNLFTTTTYLHQLRNPLSSSIEVLPDNYNEDSGLAYPALLRTEKSYYEGQEQAGIVHITRYDYDAKANTILYIDSGNGSPEDEVQAVIDYHSLPNLGIFNIPRDLKVFDSNSRLLRHRSCEVFPENGDIKAIRQYYSPSEAAVFDFEYDNYGNIAKVTRPANLHGQRLAYSFAYDDQVHTYVVETKDAYGYSSTATYDYRFGTPLEITDLNGNRMVYVYDAKGRLSTLTGPYELEAGKPYTIKMEYFPDASMPYAICRHYNEDTDSDILTVTFADGLGRAAQVKKSGLLFQSAGQADQEVMNVSGKVVYDAFGRETETYYPVSESMADVTAINISVDTETPTRTTYDILDRKRATTLPDGATTILTYSFEPAPGDATTAFLTTSEDALGNATQTFNDIRGRQLAVVTPGNITTTFTYNAIAEMTAVTDAAGNTTSFTYDMLGRQTQINHPVSGLTELFYDPIGQITRKLTSNIRDIVGQESGILYDYFYERPVATTYPLNYQNKVELFYGDSAATQNRRGKVVLQRDASGAQELFYGPMGEITKTVRTVLISPTEVRTYVSEARYDSWNRIQQMSYPDGEIVDYTYNAAGKLAKLEGRRLGEQYHYVDQISYDKFEKRRYIRLGNGVEQEYAYDPQRQWLNRMVAGSNNAPFMDVKYTYDAVSNILRVSNTAEPANGEIGGAYTHNYHYDQLYRLDRADGTWMRGRHTEAYDLGMVYDNTHNVLSKEQERTRNGQLVFNQANYFNTYQYNAGRPFIPAKVGPFHYNYDPNGNLISVTDTSSLNIKEYEWDEENRLKIVLDNGYMSWYTYDAAGERVIKSHGPVTGQAFNGSDNGFIDHQGNYTAYISPSFVARQGTYTKHYFIEGQRVCSKIGQGLFNNNAAGLGQGTLTAGNIDFAGWLQQVQANELAYYGDSLTVSHPNMPFRYVTPDSTGQPYPNLLPDTIVVSSASHSFYVLPNQPDLSGNGQADHPAWAIQQPVSADSARAGYGFTDTIGLPYEALQYFYHSDHVGSTAYITDRNGRIHQFAVYTAFGELFVEDQLLNAENTQPYLFNGKELDRETGLYYYGARYYDPVSSMWMSMDPLANKYPGWSPYNYTMLNPVRLVDPDGREVYLIHGTFSNSNTWRNTNGIMNASSVSFGDNRIAGKFNWSGENSSTSRVVAAIQLVNQIKEKRNEGPITLIGHSHGGNVAVEAFNIMSEMPEFNGIEFNLMTINTPSRSDHQLKKEALQRVNHLNIFDTKDPVQTKGGNSNYLPFIGESGIAKRTFPNARNIQVDNPQGVGADFHNSHNLVNDWLHKIK